MKKGICGVCSGNTRLLKKTKQYKTANDNNNKKNPKQHQKTKQPNTTTTRNLQTLIPLLGILCSGNSLSELTQKMQSYKGKMNRAPQRGENLNCCIHHCLWASVISATMVHTDRRGKCFVRHYILFSYSCIYFFVVQ